MATTEEASPRLLEPAFRRLREVAGIGPDWDGEGGLPPTATAVAMSGYVIAQLADRLGPAAQVVPDWVAPLGHGGVQLEWRKRAGDLELQVGPAGELGYLLVDRSGGERRFEEVDDVTWSDIFSRLAPLLGAD